MRIVQHSTLQSTVLILCSIKIQQVINSLRDIMIFCQSNWPRRTNADWISGLFYTSVVHSRCACKQICKSWCKPEHQCCSPLLAYNKEFFVHLACVLQYLMLRDLLASDFFVRPDFVKDCLGRVESILDFRWLPDTDAFDCLILMPLIAWKCC